MKGEVFNKGEVVHCPLIVGPAYIVRVKIVGRDTHIRWYYKVRPARNVFAFMFVRAKWVSAELLYRWPSG